MRPEEEEEEETSRKRNIFYQVLRDPAVDSKFLLYIYTVVELLTVYWSEKKKKKQYNALENNVKAKKKKQHIIRTRWFRDNSIAVHPAVATTVTVAYDIVSSTPTRRQCGFAVNILYTCDFLLFRVRTEFEKGGGGNAKHNLSRKCAAVTWMPFAK